MNDYTYIVSRSNIYGTRVEFNVITDALAYILGSEQMNPNYSINYTIDKRKKTEEKESEND